LQTRQICCFKANRKNFKTEKLLKGHAVVKRKNGAQSNSPYILVMSVATPFIDFLVFFKKSNQKWLGGNKKEIFMINFKLLSLLTQ
jgi:hypothetical protein